MVFKQTIGSEIVDSLRFYFMLSITLSSQGVDRNVYEKSLNEFIKDIKTNLLLSDEMLGRYSRAAYNSLDKEFLHLHNFEINPDDRSIKIVEEYHAPSGR